MESPAPYREVHKHAWLKKLPDSKLLATQKKGTPERWWTVFCVHGDAEPFLEGYQDGTVAGAHAPRWRAHLAHTTSVSGSIRHTQNGDYEFVVALQEGAVRLAAPTRDAMQDWVDTLRSKLREMKILAPRENFYSRAPEPRAGRAPTRDPMSPLPPPPGPLPRVPGTEMVPAVNVTRGNADEPMSSVEFFNITIGSNSTSIVDNTGRTLNSSATENNAGNSRHNSITESEINAESVTDVVRRSSNAAGTETSTAGSNRISNADMEILNNLDISSTRNSSHSGSSEEAHSSHSVSFRSEAGTSKSSKSDGIHSFQTDAENINRLGPFLKISNNDIVTMNKNLGAASSLDLDLSSRSLGDAFDSYVVLKASENSFGEVFKKKMILSSPEAESNNQVLLSGDSVIVFSNDEESSGTEDSNLRMEIREDIPNRRSLNEAVKNSSKMSDKNLMDVLNSDMSLPQVKLSDDVWSCDDPSSSLVEGTRDSGSKTSSTVAKISGMNVCLGESVLRREDSEGSDDFYRFYDGEPETEDEEVSPLLPSAHVSISKVEAFKRSLLETSVKNHEFPIAAPRSVVRVGGEIIEPAGSKIENVANPSGISALNPVPSLRDHIKQVNKINQSHEEQTQSSNVTVISVSNHESQNQSDKGKPIQDAPVSIDSSKSNVSVNSSTRSYVNVNIDPNKRVFKIQDDIQIKKANMNEGSDEIAASSLNPVSSLNLSVGDGYGHIRHTTTVEAKYNKDSDVDLSKLGQSSPGVSNVSVTNVSAKGRHKSDTSEVSERSTLAHSNVSASAADMSTNNGDVYESVFAPFTVSKSSLTRNESLNSSREDSPKVILKVMDPLKPSVSHFLSPKSIRKRNGENDCAASSNLNQYSILSESQTAYINANTSSVEQISTASDTSKDEVSIVVNPVIKKGLRSKINIINCSNAKIGKEPKVSNLVINDSNISDDSMPARSNMDYEYLSWVRGARGQCSTQSNESICTIDMANDNSINETNQNASPSSRSPITIDMPNLESNHNEINHTRHGNVDNEPRVVKHGLFTRGLTEFSIVTKFKNFGQARQPLLKSTQFYDDAGSSNEKSSGEVKKNSVFSTKFNIFNKFLDSKSKESGGPSGKIQGREVQALKESSLRRNWSEHNDRTAPMPVVRSPESKVLRSRPDHPSSAQDSARRRSSSLSSPAINSDESSPSSPEAVPPLLPIKNRLCLGPTSVPQPLREQQAARLRRECSHPGGVRLRLRTTDCPGEALALADAHGAVWVAGWRQRQHPLLYNALHIGDRLAAVNGCTVTSARHASRALRSSTTPRVELLLKRMPHATIHVLRRTIDGEDLGLVVEGAHVVAVIPGSPAAKAAVPSGGTLTEVNGRPLNLLLKKGDSQVRDRLNAIGQDISVLLQPTAFVALLRAALKGMRGHKEYIVQ